MSLSKTRILFVLGCLCASGTSNGANDNKIPPQEQLDQMINMGLVVEDNYGNLRFEKSLLDTLIRVGIATENPTGTVQLAGCSSTTGTGCSSRQ
jgi:hypothetical protein